MKRNPLALLLGDLASFILALWLALFLRYQELPSKEAFLDLLLPFSAIFLIWIIVLFISEMYSRHFVILRHKLIQTLIHVQGVNTLIAISFFYLVPYLKITPKTILFLVLLISFLLLLLWRFFVTKVLYKGRKERALIVGSGSSIDEIKRELSNKDVYHLEPVTKDVVEGSETEKISEIIEKARVDVLVINYNYVNQTDIFEKFYKRIHFINFHSLYEDVFGKVPIDLVNDSWCLANISYKPKRFYSFAKKIMDFSIALVLGVISLIAYPFVIVAIKLESKGPVFIVQERIGENNKKIVIRKFRTMTGDDKGDDVLKSENKVTRVGEILRKTRIDELPQLWNVLWGSVSLIGPRPELPALVKKYEENINYYGVRHIIKPGLSGWAQIYQENHPHHGTDELATKEKLAYDLFYIKNRSFILDIKIALKTLRIFISRKGI